jgi:hypothetical protein
VMNSPRGTSALRVFKAAIASGIVKDMFRAGCASPGGCLQERCDCAHR